MARIAVVGSWHLSSVMGACLAEVGHTVRGVHHDAEAIESLSRGVPTVFEPDLEKSVKKSLRNKRLSFTTDYEKALRGIGIVFLSIDTPILADGRVDLRTIKDGTIRAAKAASKKFILVVSSQVPVGTCDELQKLARKHSKHGCDLVCNPEFLRLGGAMDLQRNPDRVILGADDEKVAKKVAALYEPFKKPIMLMGIRDAEIVKHASNAYVANSVSFIGEISQICDEYGADAYKIGKALKADRRVGRYAYVMPGLGFNGGTVRRDVNLLINLAKKKKRRAPLMEAIIEVNERTNSTVVERLAAFLKKPKGKTIGLLGLTYKAQTSTLRHSLTLQLAEQMLGHGMVLKAFDPAIPPERSDVRSAEHEWDVPEEIELCESVAEAAKGAYALVVMTDKEDFRDLPLKKLGASMRKKVLVDPVNFYDADTANKAGFTYIGLGKGFKWQ